MKASWIKWVVLLVAALALSACGSVRQESALQWLQKQPNYLDP